MAINILIYPTIPGIKDFGSFIESGRAIEKGGNPYGVYPLTNHVKSKLFEGDNPNLNPPISVVIFQSFSKIDPALGYRVWLVVSYIIFACSLSILIFNTFHLLKNNKKFDIQSEMISKLKMKKSKRKIKEIL